MSSGPFFRGGVEDLAEDEFLDFDPTTYGVYHSLTFEWSCLSFDFLRDEYGNDRQAFPTKLTLVAGTAAASGNALVVAKVTNLERMSHEDEDDDDDFESTAPSIEETKIKHLGAVNRVSSKDSICATWSDAKRVYVWDPLNKQTPIFADNSFSNEGFALGFGTENKLAAGSCDGELSIYDLGPERVTRMYQTKSCGHDGSIEDLSWSPTESSVLATVGIDGTLKVFDIRAGVQTPQLSINVSNTDVNTCDWNSLTTYLFATGSDDGELKVFDFRSIKSQDSVVGRFTYHKMPITSLTWHPSDASVLACNSEDHSTSVWDLALEEDLEFKKEGLVNQLRDEKGQAITDVPPQLLFLHRGQKEPKEVRFHPQITGLLGSTALDGLDLFLCEPLDPKTMHV